MEAIEVRENNATRDMVRYNLTCSYVSISLKANYDRRTECDPTSIGSLDRDGFIKGMWRIDEELRKAQMHKPVTLRMQLRQPKPSHPPKPILR